MSVGLLFHASFIYCSFYLQLPI